MRTKGTVKAHLTNERERLKMNFHVRDYYYKTLRSKGASAEDAQRFYAQRLSKVEQARSARPFYLAFHTTPSTASNLALDGVVNRVKTAYTSPFNYPLMVLGAITDLGAGASLRVGRIGGDDWSNDQIASLAWAGADPNTTGVNMPRYFEVPEILESTEQLRLDVKNLTGLNGTYYLILIAERVVPSTDEGIAINATSDAALLAYLKAGTRPRNYTLKLPVNFAGGVAETLQGLETPQYNLPLLVTGIGTNLNRSLITISDAYGNAWSSNPIPIWAIANDFRTRRAQYARVDKGYYHRANSVLRCDVTNGIRGVFDAAAGEVDFEAQTP